VSDEQPNDAAESTMNMNEIQVLTLVESLTALIRIQESSLQKTTRRPPEQFVQSQVKIAGQER
jgi:hypothetical protein